MSKNFWALAAAWRCISYAFSLGVCHFCVALAIGPIFLLLSVPNAILVAVLGTTSIGIVGGAVAGFYSPPKSRDGSFLSSVTQTSSLGYAYGAISGLICGIIFGLFFGAECGVFVTLFVAFAGQIGGIWLGITKTIRQEREGKGQRQNS